MGRVLVVTIVCGRILPALIVVIAVFIGWLEQDELPLGRFFATVIPLAKGKLPSTIIGHGRMIGTPEIPTDMKPQPRPKNEKFLELPYGQKMPQNGLGMCCRPTAYDDVLVERTVLWYLLLGGRHIDGAHLYRNHVAIGKGIQTAMTKYGIPRNEIFVTTKLFPTHFGFDQTLKTVPKFLEELNLEYIDLLLMHGPSVAMGMSNSCTKRKINATECRQETWNALSQLRVQGVLRNVGVSNFAVTHLKDLVEDMMDDNIAAAPVANNQILYSPFVPAQIQETFEYCKLHNITITAYSPLGGLQHEQAKAIDTLQNIADKYSVSVAQIMLKWAMDSSANTAVIPGTGNPDHMRQNLDIYNLELSEDDLATIDSLKHHEKAKKFMMFDVSTFQ